MDSNTDGRIHCSRAYASDNSELSRHHHVELLVDASHAEWANNTNDIARITTQGYDFLNAIEKQPDVKGKFLDLFNKGIPYASAAVKVLSFVENLG